MGTDLRAGLISSTELVGLAAAETPNPRKAMPTAIKQTFWRIALIYISTLVVIGFAIPYNDPDLYGAGGNSQSSGARPTH
jgi:amino acid transporter